LVRIQGNGSLEHRILLRAIEDNWGAADLSKEGGRRGFKNTSSRSLTTITLEHESGTSDKVGTASR
jgi:hypothetical protein